MKRRIAPPADKWQVGLKLLQVSTMGEEMQRTHNAYFKAAKALLITAGACAALVLIIRLSGETPPQFIGTAFMISISAGVLAGIIGMNLASRRQDEQVALEGAYSYDGDAQHTHCPGCGHTDQGATRCDERDDMYPEMSCRCPHPFHLA